MDAFDKGYYAAASLICNHSVSIGSKTIEVNHRDISYNDFTNIGVEAAWTLYQRRDKQKEFCEGWHRYGGSVKAEMATKHCIALDEVPTNIIRLGGQQ